MAKRKQSDETEQPLPPQTEEVASQLSITAVPEEHSYKDTTVEETVSSESVQATEREAEKSVSPPRLSTDEEARTYVRENYTVPGNVKVVIVTSDKNVFWPENEGSAVSHALRNNLKLFRLKWD